MLQKNQKTLLTLILLVGIAASAVAQVTFIATNSTWKYLSNGTNQGTSWRASSFNDSSWPSGKAELGYGDGGEATLLSYGPSSSSKYVTYYFRKSFTVSSPSQYSSLLLNLMRDDGAVVYLNGVEVARSNMPSGTISYTTLASTAVGATNESTYYPYTIPTSLLVSGTNVLAVEIHQNGKTSPDLSFNCSLTATTTVVTPPAQITRGPYLQALSPTSIVVRWRTDVTTDTRVNYGTSLNFGSFKTDAILTKEHSIKITGLNPATKYYYSIGTSNFVLQSGAQNFFKTSPLQGSTAPVRIWATGDFGTGTADQIAVRDAFANYTASSPADMWLWMGDNAYAAGYDSEYQNYVFNIYPNQFKNIPVYPCLGNHDYANVGYQSNSSLGTNFPYFSIFTVPQNGEAGGVASGTAKYYSYNYANIHFIALDSYGSLNTVGSTMYNWLKNDLVANTQTWTVVYFHHPPYSKGTHNSDVEVEMINMRQNIVPLLEQYHVDLVLCGHSHSNERSFLIKGHTGIANTFNNSMKIGTSSSSFVKTAPYDGTVYAVCGTSGQNVGGTSAGWPMQCMPFSNNTHNTSMLIDVNGGTLTGKFLATTGVLVDQFTITKVNGTARITQDNFKIYQNNDQLVLNLNNLEEPESGNLSFYSIDGKLLQRMESIQFSPNNPTIITQGDVNLPGGIYLVVWGNSKRQYSQKVYLNF